MKSYTRVLTIAGSDSGGGAGIQADIKTISSLGCYAASAVTAVTVQNTLGVRSVFDIPPDTVYAQIDAVLGDIGTDAVKIGMLSSAEVISAVRNALMKYHAPHIVLDTVMVSTSGHRLLAEDAIETLKRKLIPISELITPNIPEAEVLLSGLKILSQDDMTQASRTLCRKFGVSVLLKSGHLADNHSEDILCEKDTLSITALPTEKVQTANTHGTGCTLSSAIASYLAKGCSLQQAALSAKEYITEAIISGAQYQIGKGKGPLNHFHNLWKD